jgi:hypothetical protein
MQVRVSSDHIFIFKAIAGSPVLADLPVGTSATFRNTSSGDLEHWGNNAGVIEKISGGGGGGTQDLDDVLTEGNITDHTIIFDPAVSQTDYEFIKVNSIDGHASQVPFRMTRWSYPQNSGAVAGNEGLMFGFNINSGGGIVESGKPAIGFSMESNYLPDFVTRYVEWHDIYIPSVTAGGLTANTQVRLQSYTINTATNNIDLYRTVGREYIYVPGTSVQYWLVQPGGLSLKDSTGNVTTGITSEYQVDYGGTKNLTRITGTNTDLLVVQGYANLNFSGAAIYAGAGVFTAAGTPTLYLRYNDFSNYMDVTVGSTGDATFNLTGTNPKFIFSDPVQLNGTLFSNSVWYTGGVVDGLLIKNSTTNNRTSVALVPNGSSTIADLWLFSTSDITTNYSGLVWGYEGASSAWGFNVVKAGTETAKSIYFNATNGQTAASSNIFLSTNGAVKLPQYGSGTFTGTATKNLSVDSSGNIIESTLGAYNGQTLLKGLAGSVSQSITAATSLTITFGGTQPNNTYKVCITPTGTIAIGAYVTSKTTTTFDVVFPIATGTIVLDWALFQIA